VSDYVAVKKPKPKDRPAVEAAMKAALGGRVVITQGWRGRLEARRVDE
jgi:nitrogen fixation protein